MPLIPHPIIIKSASSLSKIVRAKGLAHSMRRRRWFTHALTWIGLKAVRVAVLIRRISNSINNIRAQSCGHFVSAIPQPVTLWQAEVYTNLSLAKVWMQCGQSVWLACKLEFLTLALKCVSCETTFSSITYWSANWKAVVSQRCRFCK
jgi:hypothetical protein